MPKGNASQMPTLSRRLNHLLQWIPQGSKQLIDVGCDHGKLCVAALQSGRVQSVVACDLREAPLQRAKRVLATAFPAEHPLAASYEIYQTNGLQGIPIPSGTVVVIAGMGGLEIRDILRRDRARLTETLLLLHPTRAALELRQSCQELRLQILEEALCQEEQRVYPLLRVRPVGERESMKPLTSAECFWGPCLLQAGKMGKVPEYWEAYLAKQKVVLKQWEQAPEKKELLRVCSDCLKQFQTPMEVEVENAGN